MRHSTHFLTLFILLAACSDRALTSEQESTIDGGPVVSEGGPEPESGTRCQGRSFTGHQPTFDEECRGNVGCKEIPFRCGCHCVACDGPRCMGVLCDDSCMPYCPTEKPEEGSQGNGCYPEVQPNSCSYPLESCPCGPSDIDWICTCTAGTWSCRPSGYDCYPCLDGPRPVDAGIDALVSME